MKIILIFIIAISFLSNVVKAQDTDFKKSVVHASKETYEVNKTGVGHKIINNTSNHLNKDKLKYAPEHPLRWHAKDVQYDKSLVAQIFYDTFSETRLKKLADKDMNSNFFIFFNVDAKGNILEIYFSFEDNIEVRPVELEKVETRLKKELKFNLNHEIFKDYKYVPLNMVVNFKRLLDHSPNAII